MSGTACMAQKQAHLGSILLTNAVLHACASETELEGYWNGNNKMRNY